MARLRYYDARFTIDATKAEQPFVEKSGGSYSKSRGSFILPNHFSWSDVRRLARDITLYVDKDAQVLLDEEEGRRAEAAVLHAGQIEPVDARLLPHQHAAVAFLTRFRRVILADDLGMGKTISSIVSVDRAAAYPVLVVAPDSLLLQWKKEVAGTASRTDVLVADTKTPLEPASWTVMNYDVMKRRQAELSKRPFRCIIADEAVRLKNPKAERTKTFFQLAKRPGFVFLLTATPIRNRPPELWSLLHCVDPVRYSSLWALINTFIQQRQTPYGIELGGLLPDRLEDWWAEILPRVLARDRSMLNLPELTEEQVFVPLDPKAERAYKQMASSFAALTREGSVLLAPNVLTQLTRLRQITIDPSLCGLPGTSAKTKWLLDWMESNGHDRKIVVFTPFKEYAKNLAALCAKWGAVVLTGDESREQRDAACYRLNEDEHCRVLIGTDAAAGEGLNMQKSASAVAFLGKSWTPDTVKQCVGRVYRHGQKTGVHVYSLVCPGTVDEDIESVLADKQAMASEALAIRLLVVKMLARLEKE